VLGAMATKAGNPNQAWATGGDQVTVKDTLS
jgi:hypothetical protein